MTQWLNKFGGFSFPWGNEPVHWKYKMLSEHIPKITAYVWWQKTLKHYYSLAIPDMIPGFFYENIYA